MGASGGCAMLEDGPAPAAASVAAVAGVAGVAGVAAQDPTSAPGAAIPAGVCGPVAPAVTRGDVDVPAESSQPVIRLQLADPHSGPSTSLFRPPRV